MVLMFQKEVAQRIAAQSGTKEYGLLTVIAQTFWETQTVVDAGPGDFYPPPKVSSRVLQFRRRRVAWVESGEGTAQGFLTFVKAAYSHRRKLLLRNLEGGYCGSVADAAGQLASIFSSMGLETTIRAEQLDPEAMVRLYLALNREGLGRDG
jgi:16S rRNA (adenine1518-N6/adenine1519-N6)-dimethyltransferase